MKITINGTITLIPVGNVALPDYGQRKLEILETIEQEKVILDGGGSVTGLPFGVNGVLSQTNLNALRSLTNAAIGVYDEVPVEIESGGVTIWSGNAYAQQVTGVNLYGGKVLYADPALGFAAGDRVASATVNFILKEFT